MTTQNQIGLKQSFGTIWMNTGNWAGVSVSFSANTYKELASLGTNFTLMSPSQDFAMTTDGRLKYTGANTKNFNATASMMAAPSGSIAMAIYKNGSLITGAETYVNQSLLAIPSAIVSLSTNDYLSIFAKRLTGATRDIYQIILSAESLI